MKKIIFCGALANRPSCGGGAWFRLQYVLGLKRLGYDVYFIEKIDKCVDKGWNLSPFEDSSNLEFFKKVMSTFGLLDKSSLVYRNWQKSFGLPRESMMEISKDADLLINFDRLEIGNILDIVPKSIYIDTDPGYTQIWHEVYELDSDFEGNDLFFTRGENIGNPDCPIPTCGIEWKKTRPPVVLDLSNPSYSSKLDKFSTISSWYGYDPVQYKGEWYGRKDEEFLRFVTLPKLTDIKMEVALSIHPNDKQLEKIQENKWKIVDPNIYAWDPSTFQKYVRNSDAELSFAKNMYVKSNCGWFSERSACYLASGKPVLLQDTGYSKFLPVGKGLLSFNTVEEALDAIYEISQNYAFHCRAARRLAEEYFDSDKVLKDMLAQAGL